MEDPYKCVATIQDNFTEIQITIPVKRHWFTILFIGAWLGGWLIGESFAIAAVTNLFGDNPAGLFILFWLIAWTVAGFFVFRAFLWMLKGKEIITVGQGRLSIARKGVLFSRPKVYDLNEVKNLRVQEDKTDIGEIFSGRRSDLGPFKLGGKIRFEYGLKTVKIANGIDEAEARFIIDKLKERRLLTEKNLG